jgi:hypothetical protein
MSTYRSNAYTPQELERAITIGEISRQVAEVTNIDFERLTHEEYIEWVGIWKFTYKNVSDCISAQKRNEPIGMNFPQDEAPLRMSFASIIRKFANTLLNAREYARNVRRVIRKAEHDDLIADALERHG